MLNLDPGSESTRPQPDATPAAQAILARDDRLDTQLANGRIRLVRPREHVFTAGDARIHIYRVESGAICLYKIMPDGRRQVIDFAYPGDFIGLGAEQDYAFNAQALETVQLKSLPLATLSRLAGNDPDLGIKLYEAVSRELAAAQDHLFTVGQRSAAERVACFLVALSRRNARKGQDPALVQLPMTRADIADFLGLTIETVSRTLTKLRMNKIIDLKQCTLVRLLDISKLERLAGGEVSI